MKYGNGHEPMVCMLTEGACYRGTVRGMTVRGVLWHSTGANNPELRRYVQPADDAENREEMLKLLGVNKYGNDYNHGSKDRQMGVNAWIGKMADGTVSAVQTLPWGWKPWGCGAGSRGSLNDGWIQFEICEDGLQDPAYAREVYWEACELTAFLCSMFHLDPQGTVTYKGTQVPVIIDHRGSHVLGFGNNHGDVQHWFPVLLGKTMADIRNDVAALMELEPYAVEPEPLGRGAKGEQVREIQDRLLKLGYDLGRWGADGDYGRATEAAVASFQEEMGLPATGSADVITIEALLSAGEETYTVTLRGVDYENMMILRNGWPECEVTRE